MVEIEAKVLEGRLRLDWGYSEALHCRATIENLARDYVEALRSLIVHCQSREQCSYTPSDFPLAKLDQQSPIKETLDYYRMMILSQAKLNDQLTKETVEPAEIVKYYYRGIDLTQVGGP